MRLWELFGDLGKKNLQSLDETLETPSFIKKAQRKSTTSVAESILRQGREKAKDSKDQL